MTALLFIAGSVATALGYAHIQSLEQAEYVEVFRLAKELGDFEVACGNRCVAAINAQVVQGQVLELKLRGEISGFEQGSSDKTRLTGLIRFNLLGQLVETILSLTSAQTKLVLRSRNANPIVFDISGSHGAESVYGELTIAGPLRLVNHGEAGFSVTYPALRIKELKELSGFLLQAVNGEHLEQDLNGNG